MHGEFYRNYGKRIFDLSLCSLGLVLISPVLLIIALVIKLYDSGPVFFIQIRVGKDFGKFEFVKFRTMIPIQKEGGPLVTSAVDHRITAVGRLLRRFKLDELPQLYNVLKGDMSLVGPRPEVPKYVALFEEDYKDILKIRPGITDYAAIKFRNEEEVMKGYPDPEVGYLRDVLPQKIVLYKKYVHDLALGVDIKLVFSTLLAIVSFGKDSRRIL